MISCVDINECFELEEPCKEGQVGRFSKEPKIETRIKYKQVKCNLIIKLRSKRDTLMTDKLWHKICLPGKIEEKKD